MRVHPPTALIELYSRTAAEASAQVIRRYSNSFGLATSLLPEPTRSGIRSVYALVRVADEIVDGTAEEAGLDEPMRRQVLDALEAETLTALRTGFSANLTVHAFAVASRRAGVQEQPLRAFFESMRRDLSEVVSLNQQQYQAYVHGSAEAVGLICLRIFLQDEDVAAEQLLIMEEGAARLGAAFQKINFLRDFGEDSHRLGRTYFPGALPGVLTEQRKSEIVADIDADLHSARLGITLLPAGARRSTALAASLFTELNNRLRCTPAGELARTRVSVPRRTKLRLTGATLLCAYLEGRR